MSDTLPDEMTSAEYLAWQSSHPAKAVRVAAATQPKKEAPDYVAMLVDRIRGRGLPEPRREYHFHASRRWRFDLDWKLAGHLLAVEVDGGAFGRPVVCHNCHQQVKRMVKGRWVTVREGGRHNSGAGLEGDMDKLNEAALYGWRVIRVTPKMIQDGRALDWIERALGVGE